MNLPKDPVMLLSFVNTQLRDNYTNLDELAAAYMVEKETIADKLAQINYTYDEAANQYHQQKAIRDLRLQPPRNHFEHYCSLLHNSTP